MIKYKNKNIIVIDGADGVGKTTQIELLKTTHSDYRFRKFPVYSSDTGYFIQQYLYNNLDNILPIDHIHFTDVYRSSLLYTMDRVMWFSQHYNPNKDLICDRYTTSNMIHMGANILLHRGTMDDVKKYIEHLENLEYNILNIPRPTKVIYLDAPIEQILTNLNSRNILDKHENEDLLRNVDKIKNYLINTYHWEVIHCFKNGKLRTIDDINTEIKTLID